MPQVTYTIPNEKFDDFKTWFLRVCPVPLDENEDPIMSENDWIKEAGRLFFYRTALKGKKLVAVDGITLDVDIIT